MIIMKQEYMKDNIEITQKIFKITVQEIDNVEYKGEVFAEKVYWNLNYYFTDPEKNLENILAIMKEHINDKLKSHDGVQL